MNINQKSVYIILTVILLAGLAVYYSNAESPDETQDIGHPTNENNIPDPSGTITIGVIDDDAAKQIKRFQPTVDYIASKLGDNVTKYEGKVIVVKSIDNLTDLLIDGKVDLFMESPISGALIDKNSGSIPFLKRWKDGVGLYHSLFIVKNGSSIKTLDDFTGKTMVFEDPGSTSGYLLPKYYLIQNGFNVSQSPGEKNINYTFSGDDENTPAWIIEGKADIGIVSNIDFEKYPTTLKDKLKVISRTFDVPRHIVSHRAGLDPVIVERIKQILLDMDSDQQGIEILKNFQGTKKYEEISNDEILNSSQILDLIQ